MFKRILTLFVLLSCNGCALAGMSVLHQIMDNKEEARRTSKAAQDTQLETFQDLLEQGWELYVHKGKLILIKYQSEGKFLIKDVFHTLED